MPKSQPLDLNHTIALVYEQAIKRIDELDQINKKDAAALENEFFEWIAAAHNPNSNEDVASLPRLKTQQ